MSGPQAHWASNWPDGEALSPSPADRARMALLDDPGRSNAEIAISIRVRPATVVGVRRSLESLGVIAVTTVARRNFPETTPMPRQPKALMEGACVGYREPLWTSEDVAQRAKAVRICNGCHVREICLEWALSALPAHDQAIWAGLNASARAQLRRERGLGAAMYGQPWINAVKTCCNTCGLPLEGPNCYSYTTPDGRQRRGCRACRRRRTAEHQRARRAAAREAG
jgi:hypothetical protein